MTRGLPIQIRQSIAGKDGLTIHRIAARHAIFYRVEGDGSLLVVRILHAAMLPDLHLPGASDDDGDGF
jgi:plasmid stabilization system protein ParE